MEDLTFITSQIIWFTVLANGMQIILPLHFITWVD